MVTVAYSDLCQHRATLHRAVDAGNVTSHSTPLTPVLSNWITARPLATRAAPCPSIPVSRSASIPVGRWASWVPAVLV